MSISHQKFEENEVRVLIVDDDKNFAEGLSNFLEKFNISTIIENRITSAEKKLRRSTFDVVLLDVMMPEGSGFDFLPKIRRICDIPIIMLTALDEEDELVNGLNLGADDYITKPFKANELVARIKAANRRYYFYKTEAVSCHDDLELFKDQLIVHVGNTKVKLTEVETRIMDVFLNNTDKYLTRDYLYNNILNREMVSEDRSLDVHISNLRRKLGPHPTKGNRIRSVRGIGYALKR